MWGRIRAAVVVLSGLLFLEFHIRGLIFLNFEDFLPLLFSHFPNCPFSVITGSLSIHNTFFGIFCDHLALHLLLCIFEKLLSVFTRLLSALHAILGFCESSIKLTRTLRLFCLLQAIRSINLKRL